MLDALKGIDRILARSQFSRICHVEFEYGLRIRAQESAYTSSGMPSHALPTEGTVESDFNDLHANSKAKRPLIDPVQLHKHYVQGLLTQRIQEELRFLNTRRISIIQVNIDLCD